jgi:hypothetical protein
MTTKNLRTEERIASRRLLGIDGHGREHRWDMVAQTLYVLADGEVVHAEALGEEPLGTWVEFVAEECGGWETLHYAASPFDGVEVS